MPNWDLLHIQQLMGPGDLETVRHLRENGIAVSWDTDDDITAAPKGSATYKELGRKRGMRKLWDRTVEMARASHLLTTTNEHLANRYREAGVEHVQVIENYMGPEDVGRPRTRHQGLVIGLVASDEHHEDLKRLQIAEVLGRLLQNHEGVRVIAPGLDLKLRDHRYLDKLRLPLDQVYEISRQSRSTRPRRDVACLTDRPPRGNGRGAGRPACRRRRLVFHAGVAPHRPRAPPRAHEARADLGPPADHRATRRPVGGRVPAAIVRAKRG